MYTQELFEGVLVPLGSGVLAADDLSGAAVHGEYVAMRRCCIQQLLATVTTILDGAATVEFNRRVTPGSASGEVAMGTIIFPTTTAVGKVMYQDIDPVTLEAGESIAFEVTSTATSGGAIYGFLASLDPEVPANEDEMVESA